MRCAELLELLLKRHQRFWNRPDIPGHSYATNRH
jgi:hypothetical protein